LSFAERRVSNPIDETRWKASLFSLSTLKDFNRAEDTEFEALGVDAFEGLNDGSGRSPCFHFDNRDTVVPEDAYLSVERADISDRDVLRLFA
jgi:hypothetical protein